MYIFNERPVRSDYDSLETDDEGEMQLKLHQNGVEFPNNSWYFVFNSTIEDFVSLRTKKGSCFIQAFCEEMNDKWCRHDLNTIASYVNRNIMTNYKIQAPVFENQLGDLVFFKPSLNTIKTTENIATNEHSVSNE
jgi:hypothetical protein